MKYRFIKFLIKKVLYDGNVRYSRYIVFTCSVLSIYFSWLLFNIIMTKYIKTHTGLKCYFGCGLLGLKEGLILGSVQLEF